MSLPGMNVMLIGDVGTGKTHAIKSWLDAGITPFVVFAEPGMEIVNEDPRIKWAYIPPASTPWEVLIDNAKKLNTMSMAMLQGLAGLNKDKYGQFIQVLSTLHNFVDAGTGQAFGDVTTWGTDRVLVVDALSGLSIMAMDLIVGSKPIKTQPEWGVAMDNLGRLLQKLCADTKCHFQLNAHIEPERDETTGSIKNMASTLGRKLAPKIPQFFSDVILTKRVDKNFQWATIDSNTALKTRNLPLSENIKPGFPQMVDRWKERGGIITNNLAQISGIDPDRSKTVDAASATPVTVGG